jgi:chromosome segregation ATPase
VIQKHNEEILTIKENLNRFENENNYLKKEIKKQEEILDSNKLYIEELQRKNNNPNSENKLIEIETRLKELTNNENLELKKKVSEKEDLINSLTEKNKTYEATLKEYSVELDKIKKKTNELSLDEIKKKDEVITNLKNQLEQKEKSYLEEQHLIASVFHQIALQYNVLKTRMDGSPININIDKL